MQYTSSSLSLSSLSSSSYHHIFVAPVFHASDVVIQIFLQIFDFTLSPEEMNQLHQLNRNFRLFGDSSEKGWVTTLDIGLWTSKYGGFQHSMGLWASKNDDGYKIGCVCAISWRIGGYSIQNIIPEQPVIG